MDAACESAGFEGDLGARCAEGVSIAYFDVGFPKSPLLRETFNTV